MRKLKIPSFSSFILRRAVRTAVVIFLALIFSYYFSRTQTFWLTVIAALLTQAEIGFPIHQGLQRFFWILVLFFVGGQAGIWLHSSWGLSALLLALAMLTAYDYAWHVHRYLGLHF